MKKRVFLAIFFVFLLTTIANSQIYKGFGIKLGTSIADQSVSSYTWGGAMYKIGFTGGIFKETHLLEKLNLITGINYSQKGAIREFVDIDEYGNNNGTFYLHKYADFLSLEVLCKYDGGSDKMSPYILGGVRMDIFVTGKNTIDNEKYNFIIKDYPYPISNNKTFGGTIGLGLNYKTSELFSIFLEGTFNPDFTYLGEKETGLGYSNTIRNYTFEIRTGIKF